MVHADIGLDSWEIFYDDDDDSDGDGDNYDDDIDVTFLVLWSLKK